MQPPDERPNLAWIAMCGVALLVASLLLTLASDTARAVQPEEILKDPALEKRARDLSAKLRCLVCQNQSIDESNAPLAKDLRLLVRERLTAGDSNSQVIDFVVARYGEFVLLQPRFALHTLLLWLMPLIVLGVGLFLAASLFRKSRATAAGPPPLNEDEQRRLKTLLEKDK